MDETPEDKKERRRKYKRDWSRERSRERYKTDLEFRNRRNKHNAEVRKRAKEYLDHIRNSSACSSCGDKDHPWRLDFHHVDPKQKIKKVTGCQTIKTIQKEMKKCVLLCANCHRDHHYYNDNKPRFDTEE